ncbi:MAG: hypothetical protein H5T84_02250, partial [Thermoleophilia bacterium]|nr:hypothetical protein [Thermoleophilia bacterium]
MPERQVGLADTTLRSLSNLQPQLLARVERLAPLLEALDEAGFVSIDAWGDSGVAQILSGTGESPWERLCLLSAKIKRTPLQMTLRGECLTGLRPYPQWVIRDFTAHCCECGVASFLVYDALNNWGSLETVTAAVQECGATLRLGLVCAGRGEGEVEGLLELAKQLAELKPAAICVKSTSPVGPSTGEDLVRQLRAAVSLPLEIDLDNVAGGAAATALRCLLAGADVVYSSLDSGCLDMGAVPAAELVAGLRDCGLDVRPSGVAVERATETFWRLVSAASPTPRAAGAARILALGRVAGVPGFVLRQVVDRLEEQQAGDRLPAVLDEVGRIQEELGFPALVPPLAQIVATQAVINTLYGQRWRVVSDEMRAYLRGHYGRPQR